jgi:hypothetical protein
VHEIADSTSIGAQRGREPATPRQEQLISPVSALRYVDIQSSDYHLPCYHIPRNTERSSAPDQRQADLHVLVVDLSDTMDHRQRARADLSDGEDFDISENFEIPEDVEDFEERAEVEMDQTTPYRHRKEEHEVGYTAAEQHWKADFMGPYSGRREYVEDSAEFDETVAPLGKEEGPEQGPDLRGRAELEDDLFIRIISTIEATRLSYEQERAIIMKDNGLETELAKCLSALCSLKPAWPLPQHPFDMQTLRHIEDVFKAFDAAYLNPSNPTSTSSQSRATGLYVSKRISQWRFKCAQRCCLAFDAIVEVTTT